jgi:hypothetical protein
MKNETENSVDSTLSPEKSLIDKLGKWRDKLLDVGNRNPLVSCVFNPSRGVVEIVTPQTETVWRKLVADSEAGADPMRFPWRKDLVPPPADWEPKEGLFRSLNQSEEMTASDDAPVEEISESGAKKLKPKKPLEWNPPLEECRRSKKLRDTDLLVDQSDRAVDRRLRTLDSYARLAMSEQGVHALYISFGFLKWFESKDSLDERRSPLILVPVTLSRKSTSAAWELTEAEDDAIDNLCLRQRLRQDYALELPPLPDINELEESGARQAFLNSVRMAIKECDRWEVEDRVAIGLFAFPKVAMWKDLGDHAHSVVAHSLCRSIAGDTSVDPGHSFGPIDQIPSSEQLDDTVPPGEVKAILDCDSSQLEAVVAAKRGVSLVLDGPPGTGKSQTIANIIADALSAGRTVLFVSEKVSALDVVKRRLDENGLGDFCLECHSSKANRKSVLYELESCLGIQAEVYGDAQPKLNEAKQKRELLNGYVRSVHRPRMPLGLSPYELYGQVSRLTRLGFAGKSRCELPDPALVDRTTFESWLKLLERASDSSSVIRTHAAHPWRGCKLTSRSLSLSDDLQHNLSFLKRSFETIADRFSPMVHDLLLVNLPTPVTLNVTLKALMESLNAPQIPESWLVDPSRAVLLLTKKLTADETLSRLRIRLADYSDQVGEIFPFDIADSISIANESDDWCTRTVASLPRSVRKQAAILGEISERVKNFLGCLNDCEIRVTELIEQISIPIKSDLPISAISKLIDLARNIADCGIMRPAWLKPENWTQIRQCADKALSELSQAENVASVLVSRVASARLSELADCIQNPVLLKHSLELVNAQCPNGTVNELEALREQSRAIREAANEADSVLKSIFLQLGIEGVSASFTDAKRILTLLPEIAAGGMFCEAWADTALRGRLKSLCESTIADLSEADAIRDELAVRLSHRAFMPSAYQNAKSAAQYSSVIRRLFGGFSTFKKQISEFYKDLLPGNSVLLSDMDRLTRFHRRCEEVRTAFSGFEEHLPKDMDAMEIGTWQALKTAIEANGAFLSGVGPTARKVNAVTRINVEAMRSLEGRLSESLEQLIRCVTDHRFTHEVGSSTLEQISVKTGVWEEAASQCLAVVENAKSIYEETPVSVRQILQDVLAATKRKQCLQQAQSLADLNTDWMPAGGVATEIGSWNRVVSGIQAAEKLSRLTKNTDALQDLLCSGKGADSITLTRVIDEAASAYHRLEKRFEDCGSVISLSPPSEATVEPGRRPFSKLKEIASSAYESLEQRSATLQRIAGMFRDGADVDISRLDEDAAYIRKFTKQLAELQLVENDLAERGITPPVATDKDSVQWLADTISQQPISPLLRAVSTSTKTRAEADRVLADVRAAIAGEFKPAWEFLKSIFDLKSDTSTGVVIAELNVEQLAKHCEVLLENIVRIDDWLKFARWQRDMQEVGFLPILEELINGKYEPEQAVEAISVRFYRKLFDHFAAADTCLAEFDIEEHERVRERFRELDQWEIRASSTRIRQYQLNRPDRPRVGTLTGATSELGILQREIAKKRKHMPLRRLFAEIPGVLQRLKPCIMMSPLSVSTFLESDQIRFDLVIFDEASQVFPWDAIGAIYRGSQTIVAGDEKQLPPTNFFSRADTESEEDDDIADFESILSLCKSINMPSKRLRWHYRSKREPLIAFSNRHFYDSDLVTFPSIRDASGDAVRFEYVADGRWVERRNLKEAERVAELLINHLRKQPHKSVGVIAFNMSQQRAIEDVIFDRRRNDPEIDALFSSSTAEPMFVKNLENVQGDERDVIILSMAYGFNDAGKFLKNFGPLTKSGGERRLNVAVTRAKEEIILVASVRSADMDVSGSTMQGAHLLKAYLEYAEKGIGSLSSARTAIGGEADSPFEEEVAAVLQRHGLTPVLQVGCGGFRIDMALKHPERPGEFCIGIECDGATYHSSQTARDRDRIRQSVLEALGWRIVRVWSTDWVRAPEKQIDRIMAAYEMAISASPSSSPISMIPDEVDAFLIPKVVQIDRPTSLKFSSITDVSTEQVKRTIESVLIQAGATEFDDLVKLTARELGFQRVGPKIRSRLEEQLKKELRNGTFQQIGDRISVKQ